MTLKLAGDLVIDWVVHNDDLALSAGGIGNVSNGLTFYGYPCEVTTVYNPLYPLEYLLKLSPESIQDFNYQDVYIRDYDKKTFRRHRNNLRPDTFIVDADVVVAHKDSCIRKFTAFYADVRDTGTTGECTILRMSSTDAYFDIMQQIKHEVAIITHPDEVTILTKGEHYSLKYEKVTAVDDIGAGDCFNVGFLLSYYALPNIGLSATILDHVRAGLYLAHQKVQKVGVFFE